MTDTTVTLTIDGKDITVPRGTLLIRAAEQLGVIVPRFCDHPLLDPVGACRQCVVEVEGQVKPFMACTTEAGDGMVVRTHLTSEIARKGQEGTLEFLLINHPLDCPMCDKGGECPLQDQALEHGSNQSRFIDDKRRFDKPVAVSEQVLLDRERCVLCARCTRFSEQISGDPFIELFERGALEQVAIYEDEPYRSYFSGNVIQICPVGALTSTGYRFKARPFDVVTGPSVCDLCSAGCAITVQARRGEVQRQLARTSPAVNEMWSCDKGRFGFAHLTADTRLRSPQVRDGDTLADADWATAIRAGAAAITKARESGDGTVAVVAGSRLADEDAYAVSKYARVALGTDDVDFRTRFADASEAAVLSALPGLPAATYDDVEQAGTIVVVGLDPEEEVPILHLRIRKAWRRNTARIVVVGPRAGSLAPYTWRHLATGADREAEALAAVTRGEGIAAAASAAVASGYAHPHLGEVVRALREEPRPVILVGERATTTLGLVEMLAGATGARVGWVPRRAGARGAVDAGLAAGLLPGGRRLDDPQDRVDVEQEWGPLPSTQGRDLEQILTDAAAGRIKVLHLVGVDLVSDCPDPALAEQALERATVICQDLARTPTTEHADIVLPVTARQERSGHATNWEGRSQPFRRIVDGPAAVRDDWEVVVQLAALLGTDLGFHDLDQLRGERDRLGIRSQPHPLHEPGAEVTISAGDKAGDGLALLTWPLLLDRGVLTRGADDLLATAKEPFVALSPADAAERGIADGAPVEVTGAGGTVTLPARVEELLVDGCAWLPANSTTPNAAALLAGGPARVEVTAATPAMAEVGA